MSQAARCTVSVCDDDVLVDLNGGSDAERRALLERVGEWAEQHREALGITEFRVIAPDPAEDFIGACIAIDEEHCHECAAKRAADWLESLGCEVWL